MRFSTLQVDEWEKVAHFVDTLCLPIYNISISEKSIGLSKGKIIEYLVDSLEKKLTGRLLLLPSISFTGDSADHLRLYLVDVFKSFEESGFHNVVLITDRDLQLNQAEVDFPFLLHQHILQTEDTEDVEGIDQETERFYQEILDLWVKNT